jgi:uncharacterized membrane protein YfcA
MRFVVSVVVGAVCCVIGVFLGSGVFRGVSTVTLLIAVPFAVTGFGGLIYFLTTSREVNIEDNRRLPKSTRRSRTIIVTLGLFLGSFLGIPLTLLAIIGLIGAS